MARTRVSNAQKKYSDNGMHISISIDEVLDALAAGHALSNYSMTDKKYLDAIVDEAFEKAEEVFNLNAAAYAASGAISHMYEWGTVGVNKGRSNMRASPSSPSARLWHTFNEGSGLNRTLWFAYRPSLANVPKPTAADSGMSSEVIRKMRDHVFKWKAEVMEEGQEVTIAPRKAKFLLIPAYEQNKPYMRPHDIKRGYMLLTKPLTTRPGSKKFAGKFTEFWLAYWNGQGAEIVELSTVSQILSDYQPEISRPRTSRTLRPIGTMNVKSSIAKKSKAVQARVSKKAQMRRLSK